MYRAFDSRAPGAKVILIFGFNLRPVALVPEMEPPPGSELEVAITL